MKTRRKLYYELDKLLHVQDGAGEKSLEQLSDHETFNTGYDSQEYATGANARCSTILGGPNYVGPDASRGIALGGYNVVLGPTSVVEGEANKSTKNARASHTEGEHNYNNGSFSHVEGNANETYAQSAHAEGSHTTARAKGSHAEGDTTEARGEYSHTEGGHTRTAKRYDHAEGYMTVAGEENAIPEEQSQSNSSGSGSGSGGSSGSGSTNLPSDASAESSMAHAEGYYTNAYGVASHAQGYMTQARAQASSASGYHTKAVNKAQTVVGRFNEGKYNTLFEVGNGTDNTHRHNAFEVHEDGTVIAEGLDRVQDFMINNTSVKSANKKVNLQFNSSYGLEVGSDLTQPRISKATDGEINAGSDDYKPIVSSSVNTAVTKALTKSNGISLDATEKSNARSKLGILYDNYNNYYPRNPYKNMIQFDKPSPPSPNRLLSKAIVTTINRTSGTEEVRYYTLDNLENSDFLTKNPSFPVGGNVCTVSVDTEGLYNYMITGPDDLISGKLRYELVKVTVVTLELN